MSLRDRLRTLGAGIVPEGRTAPKETPTEAPSAEPGRADGNPLALDAPPGSAVAPESSTPGNPSSSDLRAQMQRLGHRGSQGRRVGDLSQVALDAFPDSAWVGEGSDAYLHVHRTLTDAASLRAAARWRALWSAENLAVLDKDPRLASLHPHQVLFFDTETTGLGGASTLVFLVGGLYLTAETVCVEQFLMPSPAAEKAMLRDFFDRVEQFGALASFNGRAFDTKALRDRAVMARLRSLANRLDYLPHLDLLPPARRIWKDSLENCRLLTLEGRVLGRHRERDIPGDQIPARYYEWLRTQDATGLHDILAHNQEDLISLFLLATRVLDMIDNPYESKTPGGGSCEEAGRPPRKTRPNPADTMVGLGSLFAARGADAKARTALELGTASTSAVLRYLARKRLSMVCKQGGEMGDAVALWKIMLDDNALAEIFAYEELAKFYEHTQRDPATALDYVEQALSGALSLSTADMHKLVHRRARLICSLERKALHAGQGES